ncbi:MULTISPECIES: glyceraldehyde-3-phosphate dehydrogenase [unclassified Oleiphilus]|uniref:glyceraldehyde-3-phosphate dehydrogenase n=1 Tax=unclassified Oleiphilus TaxID=2631174 RepID=UPI0018D4B8E8|nr:MULTISPECIES: glyceraldehyde-3-phosphate dehydrogenase [unclassified Oleiphilus]
MWAVFTAMFAATPYATAAGDMFIDPLDGMFDASRYLSENAYGFLPVPIIITDPAVEGGAGMVGVFFHESEEDKEERLKAMQSSERAASHLLPPSASFLAAAYTGNDSWFAGAGHMAFWDKGNIRYTGGGGHGDVNLAFYGFGEVQLPSPIELNTRASGVFQSLRMRVKESPLFLGVLQRAISAEMQPSRFDALDDSTLPDDIKQQIKNALTVETKTSGLGLVAEYDTRDNVFSPKEGYLYSLKWVRFDDAVGSDVDYNLTILEGLNYWRLKEDWRMGLKLYSENVNPSGFLPPFATPTMISRGIPAGRYQGNHVQQSEVEMQYEMGFRWELLAFLGAGRIANDLDDIGSSNSLINKGAGFRYHVARRYGFFMGLDLARGPEDTVWYIQAGSAW